MAAASARARMNVGIVGSGSMGSGIAVAFANARIPVSLVDTDASALDRARHSIGSIFKNAVNKQRIDSAQSGARQACISYSDDLGSLANARLAIEAVYEDLALKQTIFERLSSICPPDALLATNTSTLDIDDVGARATHSERILGLHFFSPAHVMKLVEIVRGAKTSPATLLRAQEVVEAIGKVGIVVGSCDGFVGNRMLLRYRREAELLLEEGATPQQVDAALRRFGFAMGPFAVSDLAGLDIAFRAKLERTKRGGLPFRQSRIPDRLVQLGRLGQKTGAGYFRYVPGERTPLPDDIVVDVIASEREDLGVHARAIGDEEIVERTLLALYLEGERILSEGVAASAADIDAIWRYGYGFPAAKGGPMAYARSLDQATLERALAELAQRDPAFWSIDR